MFGEIAGKFCIACCNIWKSVRNYKKIQNIWEDFNNSSISTLSCTFKHKNQTFSKFYLVDSNYPNKKVNKQFKKKCFVFEKKSKFGKISKFFYLQTLKSKLGWCKENFLNFFLSILAVHRFYEIVYNCPSSLTPEHICWIGKKTKPHRKFELFEPHLYNVKCTYNLQLNLNIS